MKVGKNTLSVAFLHCTRERGRPGGVSEGGREGETRRSEGGRGRPGEVRE